MTNALEELPQRAVAANGHRAGAENGLVAPAATAKSRPHTLLLVPVAAGIALAIHFFITRHQLSAGQYYWLFLFIVLGAGLVGAALYPFFSGLRERMHNLSAIFAAAILLLGLWEVITSGLRLLPLPYFPSPAAILDSMINDRGLLFDSTWHSLMMLMNGYVLGVIVGLISGVCIGWSSSIRYWGMPVLKIVGPIPATAWIPLAMVISPSTAVSSAALIALAVWFPVTMLTASGISNTRASYLDVARTFGAKESYLIFRVAIPAAMPNIFIGLFMGLGASFLTLVVAESVGVKSGLGWYVSWAQGWAEYGKVYAALVIMAGFFSSLMTLLFKVRDIVLVWQKGIIKW
ncbi:MAG: ABC transporter permease [Verrucomicrobia bacterium]|nr:MAG: ABC transporter permease [Verrucomicrobiota bacterium]